MAFWNSKTDTKPGVQPPIERSPDKKPEKKPAGGGLLAGLRSGLAKTSRVLNTDIRDLFKGSGRLVDDVFLTELYARLIRTDMGTGPAARIRDQVGKQFRGRVTELDEVLRVIETDLKDQLRGDNTWLNRSDEGPTVILVVGVNGSGKTTSIGKLAGYLVGQGNRVVLGAGDTFRAAAVEQLTVWSGRIGCDIVTGPPQADPASVAYQTVDRAVTERYDVAILDTAGRLQTQGKLMQELQKIRRVVEKRLPGAPTKSCWCSTRQPARTRLAKPKVSPRPPDAPGSCWPNSTARPKAAWCCRFENSSICRSNLSAPARASATCNPLTPTRLPKHFWRDNLLMNRRLFSCLAVLLTGGIVSAAAPNVVVLYADDWRHDTLGVAGHPVVQTPNIDALAGRGVRFVNNYVTTSICGVSRANLLTGQWSSRNGCTGFNRFTTPFDQTYPGVLRSAGYHVGHVGKWHNGPFPADEYDFGRSYFGKHWYRRDDGTPIHVTARNEEDAVEFLNNPAPGKTVLFDRGVFRDPRRGPTPRTVPAAAAVDESVHQRSGPKANQRDG